MLTPATATSSLTSGMAPCPARRGRFVVSSPAQDLERATALLVAEAEARARHALARDIVAWLRNVVEEDDEAWARGWLSAAQEIAEKFGFEGGPPE